MMDNDRDLTPDPVLGAQLRALDAPLDPAVVNALRARILKAATPLLAVRAKWHRRASWMDVTSSFGRVAIPLSLAAALLAMALLQQLPQVTPAVDNSQTLAYNMVGDTLSGTLLTEQMLLPDNADMILLAVTDAESQVDRR